jgi:release factor glutamine methyltransferase
MEEFKLPKIAQSAYEIVYEPREDSFLFLDSLEEQREYLLDRKPCISLEIGPGSGIVSTFLSSLLAELPMVFFGADINPDAARVSVEVRKRLALLSSDSFLLQ